MKLKHIIIGVIAIIAGILLDQLFKILIRENFTSDITIIPHFIYITHVENPGAAWGIFANNTVFLIILSLILLGVFVYMYRKIDFKENKLYSYSLTMIISGLIGNLIDRAFRSGHVTDYINVEIFGYKDFPVFNLADCLLVVGFIVFALYITITETKNKEVNSDERTNDERTDNIEE